MRIADVPLITCCVSASRVLLSLPPPLSSFRLTISMLSFPDSHSISPVSLLENPLLLLIGDRIRWAKVEIAAAASVHMVCIPLWL